MRRFATAVIAFSVAAAPLTAQQLIGYVNAHDANLSGVTDVLDGQAVLTGAAEVTAKDHTAPIQLARGGSVHVCQTSVLHLTESRTPQVPEPLLFSLDRGAVEIQTHTTPNDAIMTPDLRFAVHASGTLDLRLRIAPNGDTCVDNHGPGAPTLAVSDPFGEAQYEVAPGQHVLFEHGSLREVVDHETSPCGCPDEKEKGVSVADALLASPKAAPPAAAPAAAPVITAAAPVAVASTPPATSVPPAAAKPVSTPTAPTIVAAPSTPSIAVTTAPPPAQPTGPPAVPEQAVDQAAAEAAARAAALHPFPTAVSEGLAQPAEAPAPAAGAATTPVVEPLRYNAPVSPETASAAAPAAPSSPAKKASKVKATPQPKPAQSTAPNNDLVHLVGRFFKRLFTW